MTLVVCLDDAMGMAFGGKRQSRDSVLCRDLTDYAGGRRILMSPYSEPLFEGLGACVEAAPDYMDKACGDCLCFPELESPEELEKRAEEMLLYRWNRRYPSTLRFRPDEKCWRLSSVTEFAGSSHEKISREVYVREK